MTDSTDDRPRSRWVNVHEPKITTDIDGTPDGVTTVTTPAVLLEIDWPAAIQQHEERNR